MSLKDNRAGTVCIDILFYLNRGCLTAECVLVGLTAL